MKWQFQQKLSNNWSIIRIILWIMTISICVPYLWAARYAIFAQDDFSFYNSVVVRDGASWIAKVTIETIRSYKQWQGTYVSIFLSSLFSPLQFYSYRFLRLLLLGMLLVSIAGVFFLASTIAEYFLHEKKYSIYLAGGILIPLLSYRDYKEIYLCYTNATVYLLPILFFAFGFSFLLLGQMRRKKIYFILGAVFMFLMSGGVLEFVGVGSFCLLLLICTDHFRTRKVNKWYATVFIITLLGALANAFAPGNFVRKQVMEDNQLNIVKSIFCTIKVAFEETEWIYRNTTFLLFVILAFLFGCYLNKEIKGLVLVTVMMGLFVLPVVAIFPVAMGYGNIVASTLPERCLFILDASIIIAGIGNAILLGNILFSKRCLPEIKTIKFIIGVAALLIITTQGNNLSDYAPIKISTNLKEGTIHDFASEWRGIFKEIQSSDEEDVFIIGQPEEVEGCFPPGLHSDPEWWINQNVAEYFGKKSVCIVEEDE